MNEQERKRMSELALKHCKPFDGNKLEYDDFCTGYKAHMKGAVKIVDGFHVEDKNNQWDKDLLNEHVDMILDELKKGGGEG